MTNGDDKRCSTCGEGIPSWAIAGNCPKCMMGGSSKNSKELPTTNEQIGKWELKEKIGEGSFGVVFAVEQKTPVHRQAAMKILRPAMSSKETLARFEVERQALAHMDHADVVTIFDAGTTDDGRPYYVMEYVDGEPVTSFALRLSLEEKLKLFDRICGVVEHAHLRGIIHRDLKPANILVYRDANDVAAVKLLDFGIAKATEELLTESTLLTAEGQLLGTPEYMSPEQASGGEVDSRSDIYSLGVIFYELLTERPPHVLASGSFESVIAFLKCVSESPPSLPSEVAGSAIPQDLDWIAGKAIEVDLERRYQSVLALRDDLRRFRENKPISARPPDPIYQARQFLKRHWKITTAVAIVAASIISVAVVSGLSNIQVRKANHETVAAFSHSDLQAAADHLREGRISSTLNSLTEALRTQPENETAASLLRSVLERYPIPELIDEELIYERGIDTAYFTGDTDTAVVVTEDGFLKSTNPDFPTLRVRGSHHNSALSISENLIAVSNLQDDLHLIDLKTGTFRKEFLATGGKRPFTDLQFSSDDQRLYASSAGSSVYAWDCLTGELQWENVTGTTPTSICVSDDNSKIAVGYRSGLVQQFHADSGEKFGAPTRTFDSVLKLISIPGNRFIVLSKGGDTAQISFAQNSRMERGPRWSGEFSSFAIDRERNLIALGTDLETVIWHWDDQSSTVRLKTGQAARTLAFHPTRPFIAVGTAKRGVQIYDFLSREIACCEMIRTTVPVSIAFSRDGNFLNCATRQGQIQRYRIELFERALVQESPEPADRLPGLWKSVPRHMRDFDFQSIARYPAFENHPDTPPIYLTLGTRTIGASFNDGRLLRWNIADGKLLDTYQAGSGYIRCASISVDDSWLAYSGSYGSASVVNLQTGEKLPYKIAHQRVLASIAIDPNAARVASISYGGDLLIHDLLTGAKIAGPLLHSRHGPLTPHYCRFSPDGTRLVSWGNTDGAFRVRKAETGRLVGNPILVDGKHVSAKFHPEDVNALITTVENRPGVFQTQIWNTQISIPLTVAIVSSAVPDDRQLKLPDRQPFGANELNQKRLEVGLKLKF